MIGASSRADCRLGLCWKAPVLRTATMMVAGAPGINPPARPGTGGTSRGPARIRRGIGVAIGGVRTVIGDRHLRPFLFLSGLALLFLAVAAGWNAAHSDFLPAQASFWLPSGDSPISVFDLRIFLIDTVFLSCLVLIQASVIRYRKGRREGEPITVRGAFSGLVSHARTLASLVVMTAFAATVLFELASQSQFIGKIVSGITMTVFFLPYAYYFPNELSTAIFFSSEILAVTIIPVLFTLYAVPVAVLEQTGLCASLAGSVRLMKETRRELLGCAIVLGAIVLGILAVALLIGQSPLLLNHDYDFFLRISRGQVLMTLACYGFILACGVATALVPATLAVAVTDLYADGNTHPPGRRLHGGAGSEGAPAR